MIPSAAALVEPIYRYYPRGIARTSPSYRTSEEHLRLVALAAHGGAGVPYERFTAMLDRIERQAPGGEIHDGSVRLADHGDESCYSATLQIMHGFQNDETYYLGLRISLIAPVFVVYRSIRAVGSEFHSWSIAKQFAHLVKRPVRYVFTFTPEEQP